MKPDDSQFFKLAGLSDDESRLLALMVSRPKAERQELALALQLDEGSFDALVSRLTKEKVLETSDDDRIRISPRFAIRAAATLESSADEFVSRLRSTRFLVVGRFTEEVERVFQAAGYSIEKGLAERTKIRVNRYDIAYSFIAEKFYRFGVMTLGSETLQPFTADDLPAGYLWRVLPQLEDTARCLGTFVLFGPELTDTSISGLKRTIEESQLRYGPLRGQERFLFVQDANRQLRAFLEESLGGIESRRENVVARLAELRNKIRLVRDLVVEDSMMVTELNSLVSGAYRPLRRKPSRAPSFMPTIKSVVDRESRNLSIFERKFNEEKGLIERWIDEFDKRRLLPDPATLKDKVGEFSLLEGKFKPIREELVALTDLLLNPTASGARPMKANPFLLTEPNDMEAFTVNQEGLKAHSDRFYQRLVAGGAHLLFVTGGTGTGKTHALKHVFLRRARDLNIWPVYVDCPQGYDFVSSMGAELTQDRNYPNAIRDMLPALRKHRPATEFEFIGLLKQLRDMVCAVGYRSLVIIVDEFENSLPYTYDFTYTGLSSKGREAALAIKQLEAVLSSDLCKDVGMVIAFRDHILQEVRDGFHLKDFDSFTIRPETLSVKHFQELAELRETTWKSKHILFPLPLIRRVVAKTESNTRHTIQYFRALYRLANEKKLDRVSGKVLDEVGDLALFTY